MARRPQINLWIFCIQLHIPRGAWGNGNIWGKYLFDFLSQAGWRRIEHDRQSMINQQKPPVGSKTPTWPTLHRVSANSSNQLEKKETFERCLTMIWTTNKANVLLCQVVTEQKYKWSQDFKILLTVHVFSHCLGFCCCCCWTFDLVGLTIDYGALQYYLLQWWFSKDSGLCKVATLTFPYIAYIVICII